MVEVEGVDVQSVSSSSSFTAKDDQGEFIIYSKNGLVQTGKMYSRIVGVMNRYNQAIQLIPRNGLDVVENEMSVLATPNSGTVTRSTPISLHVPAEGAVIRYTTDGSDPDENSNLYEAPLTLSEDTTVKAIAVQGDQRSEIFSFQYQVLKELDQLRIHDIQGGAHRSPYEGLSVKDVEGIVIFVSGSTFYIQEQDDLVDDNDATSEAIAVYFKSHGVKPGDRVSISGTIKEYTELTYTSNPVDLTTTEVVPSVASDIRVLEQNVELPKPIILGKDGRIMPTGNIKTGTLEEFDSEANGMDFFESLESMRIQLNDAEIIGPYSYELPVLVDNGPDADEVRTPAGGLLLTERGLNPQRLLIDKKPKEMVKTGDHFAEPVIGVMSYNFSNYKILPEELPAVVPGDLERAVTHLTPEEDKLNIASFNLENFSPTAGKRIGEIGEAIVHNLQSPDILALLEVQDGSGTIDDGVTDASASYGVLIKAIEDAGGPSYKFTDIEPENNRDGGSPGGNIRVGYLYNPERVTLTEKPKGESTDAVSYDENGLTLNPGRIEPQNEIFRSSRKPLAAEFEFKGEKVVVIGNHFNSKLGDGAPFGGIQPFELKSEVQRAKIAAVVNGFVQQIQTNDPDANVVVLGDLNDFQFSNALSILRGKELINLVDELPENERYSYVYEGNSQTLDHILVGRNLTNAAKLDIVHINADFMDGSGRVSDHDPLLVQLDLSLKTPPGTPGTEQPGNPGNPGSGSPGSGTPTTPPAQTPPVSGGGNSGSAPSAGGTSSGQVPGTVPGNQGTVPGTPTGTAGRIEMTPAVVVNGGIRVAEAQLEANAIRQALQTSGTDMLSLRLSLGSGENADRMQMSLTPEALRTAVSGGVRVLSIETPNGGYSVPLNKLGLPAAANAAGTSGLQVTISSNSQALSQVETLGWNALQAVDFELALVDASGTSRELRKFDTYVKRTIPLSGAATGSTAVLRLETAANGTMTLSPVPFKRNGSELIVYSRTNSTYVAAQQNKSFTDTKAHWANAEITALAAKGIVDGVSSSKFSPGTAVTRAEFTAMLVRMLGLTTSVSAPAAYEDVQASGWYAGSVSAAAEAGLIGGYTDGTFRPNAQVTRQEMAAMVARALNFAGYSQSGTSSAAFTDTDRIPAWSAESVNLLGSLGLVQGDSIGRFLPDRHATRAESAAMLGRALDVMDFSK